MACLRAAPLSDIIVGHCVLMLVPQRYFCFGPGWYIVSVVPALDRQGSTKIRSNHGDKVTDVPQAQQQHVSLLLYLRHCSR